VCGVGRDAVKNSSLFSQKKIKIGPNHRNNANKITVVTPFLEKIV